MNNEKIDLILRGINLLIIKDKDIAEEFKSDFNKDFFDIYHKEEQTTLPSKTKDALRGKSE